MKKHIIIAAAFAACSAFAQDAPHAQKSAACDTPRMNQSYDGQCDKGQHRKGKGKGKGQHQPHRGDQSGPSKHGNK